MDAAIATLFCNGLVSAHSMGIGGGFLMTVYTAEGRKAAALDARETAPGAATPDMYHGDREASAKGDKKQQQQQLQPLQQQQQQEQEQKFKL